MTRSLALLAALLAGAWLIAPRRDRPRPGTGRVVRAAGPEQMRDPPPDWSDTDERADQSFPASDPPGTY